MRKYITNQISRIDDWHLELLGFVVVSIIMAPILVLGKEAVFPIHDQLDETILSYVFGARFWGKEVYPSMLNGVNAIGLKPSAIIFIPLYLICDTFTAFIIQYAIVVFCAFFGTFFCVKRLTGSSIAALLSSGVFSLLPFRSIYGLSVAGTPLLIACVLVIGNRNISINKKIYSFAGVLFYIFTTNLVLSGYVALLFAGLYWIVDSLYFKKSNWWLFFCVALMTIFYMLCNMDLLIQFFAGDSMVSHREEMAITGGNFGLLFKDIFLNGLGHTESFHKYIFLTVIVAFPIAILNLKSNKRLSQAFFIMLLLVVANSFLYAFFACSFFRNIQSNFGGMLRSFQFSRFLYFVPGCWYILLGISLAIIMNCIRGKHSITGICISVILFLPTLLFVAKNNDCIFYQNVNQINNPNITGYITWEKLYAEDICNQIAEDIGKDQTTYRVASIGVSPVVSLMNGFYTIDGYSNNYPLEYKHRFEEIIDDELRLNEFNHDYFYDWGSRCYLFYHEWGNAFYVGKGNNAVIHDFRFNIEKMKEMGCNYIFSAGEIEDCERHGLNHIGTYETETSFWRIWVYELCNNEQS